MFHGNNKVLWNMLRISLLVLYLVSRSRCHDNQVDRDVHVSSFLADLWLDGAEIIKILWKDCSKKLLDVKDVIDHKEYFPKFMRCMKRKTLRALDRSLSTDIVPIAEGINLVRFEEIDKAGKVMAVDNDTSSWSEKELEEGEWRTLALQRMAKVLRTHVMKFDLDVKEKPLEKAEYRGRRRHQMMTMMMFGMVSLGMVLVPMGFQFLAVLGGKALLLAKMALILASIQGLKKIATAPLSYGFYNTYPPPPPPPPPIIEPFEKRSQKMWPPPSMMAGTPPPALPRHNLWDWESNFKMDRTLKNELLKSQPTDTKPGKSEDERKLNPVYTEPVTSYDNLFNDVNINPQVLDVTTPSEVQADYTLELPYNGFQFQSPTSIIST